MLNDRIKPITALDAKNNDKMNVKDIRPIFDPSMKLSTNWIIPLLLDGAGIISVIITCNWCFNPLFETKGKPGINVKIKRHVGGNAIIKL